MLKPLCKSLLYILENCTIYICGRDLKNVEAIMPTFCENNVDQSTLLTAGGQIVPSLSAVSSAVKYTDPTSIDGEWGGVG